MGQALAPTRATGEVLLMADLGRRRFATRHLIAIDERLDHQELLRLFVSIALHDLLARAHTQQWRIGDLRVSVSPQSFNSLSITLSVVFPLYIYMCCCSGSLSERG
ncbi:hypothetical protein Scep_023952 [Stephania cephalantha]|uniref:Uncharacterized protein n=1 Tax=Stephania cephalantha TaxID=152367 RepID=A0AAP0EYI8_9MAGN